MSEGYPAGYPPAFVGFHDANPALYDSLVAHARRLKRRGFPNVGMRYLFEYERYNSEAHQGIRAAGIEFGLNNNWSTSYGKLVEEQEQDLRGFFRRRRTREEIAAADASQTALEFD